MDTQDQGSTDNVSAAPAATVASDVQATQPAAAQEKADSTAPTAAEPAPANEPPTDDPLAGVHDAVTKLGDVVGTLVDQVNELATRVEALEQAKADGGLQDEIVKQAQDIMRVAMTSLSKDFADLPEKVKRIEGKLKHF